MEPNCFMSTEKGGERAGAASATEKQDLSS